MSCWTICRIEEPSKKEMCCGCFLSVNNHYVPGIVRNNLSKKHRLSVPTTSSSRFLAFSPCSQFPEEVIIPLFYRGWLVRSQHAPHIPLYISLRLLQFAFHVVRTNASIIKALGNEFSGAKERVEG